MVISTTTFLQKRLGGRILNGGVDTDFFAPQAGSRELRAQLGFEGMKLIVFGGVVQPHKGIELIPRAVARLGDASVRLVIVGPRTDYVERMLAHPDYGRFIVALGSKPKGDMPRFLNMADVVVLPLLDNLLARSQMPCKVFEAMAMAKPVIASAISDLPMVLGDCGWVVPAGDVDALAGCLKDVLGKPGDAVQRGRRAREKCLRLYSKEQMRENLRNVLDELTAAPPARGGSGESGS
jgi:glycosyltransferase involved in cell wall biosynthesis